MISPGHRGQCLSKLIDVFRRAADRYVASFPAPIDFLDAARSLLAADPELPRIIRTSRQRRRLISGPLRTPAERGLVFDEIWKAIARAAADAPLHLNNPAAILGAKRVLMAYLIAKGLRYGSDPRALEGVQAFLVESRKEAGKLRRQINGARRGSPPDRRAIEWLRKTAPLWRQRKPNGSSSSGARWLFTRARRERIFKWANYEFSRVSAYKNGIRI